MSTYRVTARWWRRWATLAAALMLLAPLPGAEGWTGVVEVAETISGPQTGGSEQKELERYAHIIEERLRQAHDELATAPPAIARVIREDIGFYEAERDRVVVAHGGELTIGRTYYQIKRERMVMITDGARLLIDRGANTITGTVDGLPKQATLARIPDQPAPQTFAVGPDYTLQELVYHTRHQEFQLLSRSFSVDFVPGLPNPWALSYAEGTDSSDPATELAKLPGLPVLISSKESGQDLTRSLRVVTIDRHDISEDAFAP
jgi:hypothetical protein